MAANRPNEEEPWQSRDEESFDEPDAVRTPPKAKVDVVNVGGTTVGRATLQPGWRWSESIKPIVGTENCEVHHVGVLLSGRLHVVHRYGSEAVLGPGDIYNVEPGNDAWVEGDEPAVASNFDPTTAQTFAEG